MVEVVNIASLASLRMWKAYQQVEVANCNFALVQNTSGTPTAMMDSCTKEMEIA